MDYTAEVEILGASVDAGKSGSHGTSWREEAQKYGYNNWMISRNNVIMVLCNE